MAQVRLQKYLAEVGLCSRRKAEDLMRQGRVTVDGQVTEAPGHMIDPETATVALDGQVVGPPQKLAYYMFHKPSGFLTTLDDPRGRPTVKGFLDKLPVRVYPVGRLDLDVSGLLILTNDGQLAMRLMHPSYLVSKIYRAKVKGLPSEEKLDLLRTGQILILGKPAAPAKARMLKSGPDKGQLELTLTEGRHRQVKRMCAAIGHEVIRLKRIAYCDLPLPPDLPPGQTRKLSPSEIRHLKAQVGLVPADSDPKK
ncbi:MAG: rRNA pseudouridine synthase [Deltaproteobacteria bacterium]|jgi:23S rRNA pseudouridine2605 synthase|nr:rRNA pseudouridine synthase [Deltaproteobacteria bacterium]